MNYRKAINRLKIIILVLLLFLINFTANAQEGTLKWTFSACGGSPAIGADGTIYCVGDGLVAVNPDGTQKWVFPDIHHTPAIGADGTIYAAGSGNFYAIKPDGTEI